MNEQKSSVEPVLLQRRDLNLTIFHHHYSPNTPVPSKESTLSLLLLHARERGKGGSEKGLARGKTYKPHPKSYLTTPFQCSQPLQPVRWCSYTYPHAQFNSKSVPFNEGRGVQKRGRGIYPHTHPTTARCRLGTNQALAEYNPPAVGKALFPHQRQANQEEEEKQKREEGKKTPQRHRQSSVPPQRKSQESKSQRGKGRKGEGGVEEEKKTYEINSERLRAMLMFIIPPKAQHQTTLAGPPRSNGVSRVVATQEETEMTTQGRAQEEGGLRGAA